MRIQHNIAAMNAYRNYNNNTSAVSKNLEKLSSGYKINRAGDDAAGLAISEKMRAQITGLEAAQKNVKDGISLVKTAEGAMQEVQDMLNRMVSLATQSANGTYDNEVDRANLQKEVDQLKAEINRIADSSNFNGIKLLDGSLDTSVKSANEIDLSMNDTYFEIIDDGQLAPTPTAGVFRLDLDDFKGFTEAGDVAVSIFGEDLDLGEYFAENDEVTSDALAKAVAEAWNNGVKAGDIDWEDTYGEGFVMSAEADGSSVTFTMSKAPNTKWNLPSEFVPSGVTMTGFDNDSPVNQGGGIEIKTIVEPVDSSSSRLYARGQINLEALVGDNKIKDGSTLTIGDTTYTFALGRDSAYKDAENVIDLTDLTRTALADNLDKIASRITTAALNNKNFHVTATGNLDDDAAGAYGAGAILLTEREGGVDTNNYKLEGTDNADDSADGDWTGLLKLGQVDTNNMGNALTLQIGDTSDSYNQLKVSIGDIHTAALGINGINIGTQDGAAAAVNVIKNAINSVSSIRGTLGATQNRLEHTQNNLSVMAENIQDAESTIRDTDIAEEMMAYTKNNILVQSAQAMLAQANQIPQGVLQLLG